MTGSPAPADAEELRRCLERLARAGRTATYQEVATELGLAGRHRIHRVAEALETTMDEDAAAGRPLLAAVVVSRARAGLPAPGFFARARALGRHQGAERGREAADFHARELERVFAAFDGRGSAPDPAARMD